jgi:phospholipid/cholesterol/gamma-HCH transport system ATP-binding protein
MDAAETVLEFDHVWLTLDDKAVLRDVSFQLARGENKLVLGAAASGKSVLLKTAVRLFRPDSGRVLAFGHDITNMSEDELYPIRQRIGMVFQEGALFDSLTVGENVAYVFQEDRALPPEEEERRVRRALRFVGLEEALEKLPSELSGGMRRRVAIARAFVGQPELILYDSPTAGLDPVTAQSIITLIVKLGGVEKVSGLVVTHRPQDVDVLSNCYFDEADGGLRLAGPNGPCLKAPTSALVLREGQVVFDGSRSQMFSAADPYVRRFIG